jgi:hypothetical protein
VMDHANGGVSFDATDCVVPEFCDHANGAIGSVHVGVSVVSLGGVCFCMVPSFVTRRCLPLAVAFDPYCCFTDS